MTESPEPAESSRFDSVMRRILGISLLVLLLYQYPPTTWFADPPDTPKPEPLTLSVDLNRADIREISLLPGVGPKLAQRIVDDRDTNGLYESVEQLDRVPGIGVKMLQSISKYCRVDPETNHSTAARP
jgi:competence ComEA-like helix-hairpin-helix protein